MDPNACLERMLKAFAETDTDEAVCAMEDLIEWLRTGGFPPTVVGDGPAYDDDLEGDFYRFRVARG